MDVPSMVQRSGDTLIVRSVVSGDQIFLDKETGNIVKTASGPIFDYRNTSSSMLDGTIQADIDDLEGQIEPKDEGLPQCKIKRNYSCNSCTFFTQNPRYFLTHLRDTHGEKIVINECKLCLYASRHYQKLVRHMKMVHGSLDGIEEHGQSRKRHSGREGRKRKVDDSNQTQSNIQQQQQQQLQLQQQQQQQQQQLQQQQLQQRPTPPIKFEEQNFEITSQNRLLKCSVCEFTTLYRGQLVEHEQDDHCKTKFFRCEKCSYVTHIKARFSKHVKYHSMPMIKCDVCDFRTPYKWNLDRHMKNHGGTGPFRCAACNFTADIKQSLTVHEMNHHVPPVGHAAGMSMARRKNKVGGTDVSEDFMSENGDLDGFNNNNNIDDFDEPFAKRCKYPDDEQPTDLSQKSSSLEATPAQPKKTNRPVPNLIPIQAAGNALNLSKTFFENFDDSKNTLKDIASFFFPDGKIPEVAKLDKIDNPQLSPSSNSSSNSKRRTGNFFDKLKETMNAAKNENLICDCGYVSKCLSESIIHQSSCQRDENRDKYSSPSPINLSVNSGSTRCQYCRHRCKSSVDLIHHLKNCTETGRQQPDSLDSMSDINEKHEDDIMEECQIIEQSNEKHPMENKVFVWNKVSNEETSEISEHQERLLTKEEININEDKRCPEQKPANYKRPENNNENGYYGVETAPGYGEVTKKMTPEEEAANSSLKKVYKCPHCSFWASTASRFHVHIVGHLNKKPFECSLCAYRSNWRWDITKHIRLKTIRDPSHKNAKVLMNDETGRRNYTKYNKYITLMKVTEEDGDPKLMKSGEMTPNQEASLSFLNDRQNEAGTSSNLNMAVTNPNRFVRFPFFSPLLNPQVQQTSQSNQGKRSPPLLIKPSEEVVAQNIDVKADGSEKKTLYKCRKCNFRHANRDTVLSHVKTHYQEVGMNLTQKQNLTTPLQVAVSSNIYMNKVFAAMCLSQQAAGKSMIPNQMSLMALSPSVTAIPTSSLNTIPTNPLIPMNLGTTTAAPAKANEHGEPDEASSGVVTTTGTGGVTGWRGPAPYRCGLCHQVSNWKHVIQRHCRLKHNGDIRIETVDRNSNKNSPIYHPLMTHSGPNVVLSNNQNQSQNQNSNNNSNNNLHHQQQQQNHSQNIDLNLNDVTITATAVPPRQSVLSFNGGSIDQQSIDTSNKILPNNNGVSQLSELLGFRQGGQQQQPQQQQQQNSEQSSSSSSGGSRLKQMPCPCCPFISESKSQMNYHISLHKFKPDQYECQSCAFTCSKKILLTQHCKQFHEDNGSNANIPSGVESAIDLRSKEAMEDDSSNDSADKILSFCAICPARYFSTKELKLHIKSHESQFPYRCRSCSYTTRQEPCLLSHSAVHTQVYQDTTQKLYKKYKEDPEHPQPKLMQIQLDGGEKYWVVDVLCSSVGKHENENNSNSLLKRQLEANKGTATTIVSPISTSHKTEAISSSSLIPSSTRNVIIDQQQQTLLTAQNISSSNNNTSNINNNNNNNNNNTIEECLYCPFETTNPESYKAHLKNHQLTASNNNNNNNKNKNINDNDKGNDDCDSDSEAKFSCDHCENYKVSTESELKEHIKLHFKSIKNCKNVAFYTSYDNLELNVVNCNNGGNSNNNNKNNNNNNSSVLDENENDNVNIRKITFNKEIDNNENKNQIIKTENFLSQSLLNHCDEDNNNKRMTVVDVTNGEIIKNSITTTNNNLNAITSSTSPSSLQLSTF